MIKFLHKSKSFTINNTPVVCGSESKKIWGKLKTEDDSIGHAVEIKVD
jgi:hypothetical protein